MQFFSHFKYHIYFIIMFPKIPYVEDHLKKLWVLKSPDQFFLTDSAPRVDTSSLFGRKYCVIVYNHSVTVL